MTSTQKHVNLDQQSELQSNHHLPEKALKATDVCKIFRVSRPTLYEWAETKKLKNFKIKSRRYFSRADIEVDQLPGCNHNTNEN